MPFTSSLQSRPLLSLENNPLHQAIKQIEKGVTEKKKHAVFLLHNWNDKTAIPKDIQRFQYAYFNEPEDYFSSVFNILKALFPPVSIEQEIEAFKKDYAKLPSQKKIDPKNKKLTIIAMAILAVVICLVGFLAWQHTGKPIDDITLRSDLVLPAETAFLERTEILEQIEKKLDGKESIQTIVLVGTGRAGKTTLARYYGRQCKASVVWKINAETKTSLLNSFKDLAYALTKTEGQSKKFNLIQGIRNPEEKEKQLLFFIKQFLKEKPNWLLIYDNVDNIEEVSPYLPQNQSIWGRGKVILTTRDANIKDSNFVKPDNIIEVDESMTTC